MTEAPARDQASIVAIIPARAGSKRVSGKNSRPFHGKPLLTYAIETALASKLFGSVVVSTEDQGIKAIAERSGAQVPFLRPLDLADDHTSAQSVVAHALEQLHALDLQPTVACCLYPTAVLVEPRDLVRAFKLLPSSSLSQVCVASTVRFSHPIERSLVMGANGTLVPTQKDLLATRTQDFPTRWYDAGQFYWANTARWLDSTPLLEKVIGYELPPWRAVDIDNEADWTSAEEMYRYARFREVKQR